MKRLLAIAGLALLTALLASTPASATGDDGWTCPDGTTYSYKIDNLSGDTFTVPGAPEGWEVLGVSIKAGTGHYDYPTAVTGDVIAVKTDTGHATSHAHICKREIPPSTTTTTSTSTTSTSTVPSSTTTPPTTTGPTTTTSAPSTTAPTTTPTSSPSTTSAPSSTQPPTTQPTTSAPTIVVTTPTTTPSSPPPTAERVTTVPPETVELPKTGSDLNLALAALAACLVGGAAVIAARRP